MNVRQQTLDKAARAVGSRPEYGPPERNFEAIARRWNAHLENLAALAPDRETLPLLTAADVALMMGDVKAARLTATPEHEDSWVDLAGYAACGAESAGVELEEPSYELTPAGQLAAVAADIAEQQDPAWKRAKVGDIVELDRGWNWGGGDRCCCQVEEVDEYDDRARLRVRSGNRNRWALNSRVLRVLRAVMPAFGS